MNWKISLSNSAVPPHRGRNLPVKAQCHEVRCRFWPTKYYKNTPEHNDFLKKIMIIEPFQKVDVSVVHLPWIYFQSLKCCSSILFFLAFSKKIIVPSEHQQYIVFPGPNHKLIMKYQTGVTSSANINLYKSIRLWL